MSMNLSRRRFLSNSARSALVVAACGVMEAKGGSVFVNSFAPFAQSAAVQPVFARLDEYIARHMRETGAPGLTLALANRDGLIRASTYGFADTKAGVRIAPDTMFEIGSISKSFVALALMQLRDERKLDLNK